MPFVLFKDSFTAWKVAAFNDADLLANFVSRYTNATLGALASINNTGRNGNCLSIVSGGGSFFKTLPHSARWVTGFAFRPDTASSTSDPFYQVLNNDVILFSLRHDADGTLALVGGNVSIDVTDRALLQGRWYYLEIDLTFSGSTPVMVTAELRINGNVEASGTGSCGVNASSLISGAADANVHSFAPFTGPGNGCSFDDLEIKNEGGYFGDVRIIATFPDADAGILDWTPNSGTVHFDRVNTHPVDLTKWLETATPGDIDLWNFTFPSFSGTIAGINIRVLARKDDEGTKSFKIVVGATGTDAESDEFFVSDATSEYYEFSLKLDPATASAFLPGQTLTVGVKLVS